MQHQQGIAGAKGLIEAHIANKVLLVTAETYSKMLHPRDISNRSIFGDGAAASVIERSSSEGIWHIELGTDGSGFSNLIVANGCFRNGFTQSLSEVVDESGNIRSDNNLYMNGPEIFNFTIESAKI